MNFVLIVKARQKGLQVPSFIAKAVVMGVLWFMFIAFAGVTVGIEMSHGKRIIEWWATLFIGIYFFTAFWDWKNIRISVS